MPNRKRRSPVPTSDQMWLAVGTLAATHQIEELVFSIDEWLDRVGTTGWPRFDACLQGNALASTDTRKRTKVVVAQAVGLGLAWEVSRRSVRMSRTVTSALTLGFAAAFTMHIVVATRTRSPMPGLATSLVPGIPGAIAVWRYIQSDA